MAVITHKPVAENDNELPHYEEIVLDAITEPPKLRNGVKITDITTCCRLKIFEIVNPKERAPQDKVRTASGTAIHRYLQKKISNPDPERYDVELPVDYKKKSYDCYFGNIYYTPR